MRRDPDPQRPRSHDGDVAAAGKLLHSEWTRVVDSLGLSPRQAEIVEMLVVDATEPAVAERLGISKYTVRSHVRRLYAKLGVHSRVELAARVWGQCMAAPPDRVAPRQAPPDEARHE